MATAVANKVLYKLTDTDVEIIKLLCLPDKVIGQYFKISPAAVSMRIWRICIKFGVENRTAIVVKALRLKLIKLDQLICRDSGAQNYGQTNLS